MCGANLYEDYTMIVWICITICTLDQADKVEYIIYKPHVWLANLIMR